MSKDFIVDGEEDAAAAAATDRWTICAMISDKETSAERRWSDFHHKYNNKNADDEQGLEVAVTLPDLAVLLCPSCTHSLTPPVFQCDDGHIACESCCNLKRKRCPSCSLPTGFVRNRAIERVVQSAKISCGNRPYGCKERVSYVKKCDHEKTCKYAPIRCPLDGCEFAGKPECFYTHFRVEHPKSFQPLSFGKADLIFLGKDQERFYLQESVEDILFVLNRFADPRGSLINVTCVAPTSSAMKFSYELTALSGEKSISVKTMVELSPELIKKPPVENCLLITNDFHEEENATASFSGLQITVLGLKLIIRKVN